MTIETVQRPHRGSRVSAFYPVKSVPPLSSLDSAFQLQEYISLLIRLDVHDVDTIVALPGRPGHKDSDDPLAPGQDTDRKGDIPVDRACWIYEQLRRLAQDLSHPLITALQQECTRSSCPQMKAGEWLYLCVAHGNDGAPEQCCAIDYILHTLDSATALLNSPRAFPSRISIPQTSHHHFSSLARRLGRIFAHAYFHHREAFQQAEAESSLYARFLKLAHLFGLVPPEFLVIPENAIQSDGRNGDEDIEPPRLLVAAVHPQTDIPSHPVTVEQEQRDPADTQDTVLVENTSSAMTDSPRRPGRNRTDTMVFSEAYSIAEELAKGEAAEDLQDSPVETETESVSQSAETASHTELMAQEMDRHVEEEPIPTGPGSPTGSLISPGELTGPPEPPATSSPSAPAFSPPDVKEEIPVLTDLAVSMAIQEAATEGEGSLVAIEHAENQSQEVELVQSPDSESSGDSLSAGGEPVSELEVTPAGGADEPHAESATPSTLEFTLDLSEPPPAEPIPPESDITDEVCDMTGHGPEADVAAEDAA